jgi:hypothetical protein
METPGRSRGFSFNLAPTVSRWEPSFHALPGDGIPQKSAIVPLINLHEPRPFGGGTWPLRRRAGAKFHGLCVCVCIRCPTPKARPLYNRISSSPNITLGVWVFYAPARKWPPPRGRGQIWLRSAGCCLKHFQTPHALKHDCGCLVPLIYFPAGPRRQAA